MSSYRDRNKPTNILYGPGTPDADDASIRKLRKALGRVVCDATETMFAANGPYPANTHIIRPAVAVEPFEPSEEYFVGVRLRILWNGEPRSHREADPFNALNGFIGSMASLRQRSQGRISGNPSDKIMNIEGTPDAFRSIYNTIAKNKCPNYKPLRLHVSRIGAMIERINLGPGLII